MKISLYYRKGKGKLRKTMEKIMGENILAQYIFQREIEFRNTRQRSDMISKRRRGKPKRRFMDVIRRGCVYLGKWW